MRRYLISSIIGILLFLGFSEAKKPLYGQGYLGGIYYRTPQAKEYVRLILGGDIGVDFIRAGIRLLPFDWIDVYAKLGSDSFWIYGGKSLSFYELTKGSRSFIGVEFAFIQFSLIFEYAEHYTKESNFGAGILFYF